MTQRSREKSPQSAADRGDFHLGILIAIGVGLLVVTLVCELTGQPAVLWALMTGAVTLIVGRMLWTRRSRSMTDSADHGEEVR